MTEEELTIEQKIIATLLEWRALDIDMWHAKIIARKGDTELVHLYDAISDKLDELRDLLNEYGKVQP